MTFTQQAFPWRRSPLGLEVRYERSFLRDLQRLEPVAFRAIQQFALEDFTQVAQLQDLPEFRPLGSSGIYYRCTCDRYFIALEVTGQLVKFLRVVGIPQI